MAGPKKEGHESMENNKIESQKSETDEKMRQGQKSSRVNITRQSEDDNLIIEENTIYEIDLDCYECLMRERKKLGKN